MLNIVPNKIHLLNLKLKTFFQALEYNPDAGILVHLFDNANGVNAAGVTLRAYKRRPDVKTWSAVHKGLMLVKFNMKIINLKNYKYYVIF